MGRATRVVVVNIIDVAPADYRAVAVTVSGDVRCRKLRSALCTWSVPLYAIKPFFIGQPPNGRIANCVVSTSDQHRATRDAKLSGCPESRPGRKTPKLRPSSDIRHNVRLSNYWSPRR
jgi:hypothetical protein